MVAFLPSKIAYRAAELFGGLVYRVEGGPRAKVKRNMKWMLGSRLDDRQIDSEAMRFFKSRCCEFIDVYRAAGGIRFLSGLVEVRGLEGLDESLAKGKGVVMCGAHFSAFRTSISVIGARGYPITPIVRLPPGGGPNPSPFRRARDWARLELLMRYTKHPKIEVQSGNASKDLRTATLAAKCLAKNEIVYLNVDATVIPSYRARAVRHVFLGREALFLPGAVSLAAATGAGVHLMLTSRSRDYRHQTITISPAYVPQGKTDDRFPRIIDALQEVIGKDLAGWEMWDLLPNGGTYFPGMIEGAPKA